MFTFGKLPFKNPEVHQLYEYGFEIPPEVIREILALPRATLISDLEWILLAAYKMQIYLLGIPYDPKTHTYPVHAMLLLGALEADESLPDLLEIYNQNQEFNDFWLRSLLDEEYWLPLYWCGKDQVKWLAAFLIGDAPTGNGHKVVVDALLQIALHHDDKREEVKMIVHYTLNRIVQRNDRSVLGLQLTNALLYCVGQLRIEEAIPWVHLCYNEDLADFDDSEWEALSYCIVGSKEPDEPREIPNNIYALYKYLPQRALELENLQPKIEEIMPNSAPSNIDPAKEDAVTHELLKNVHLNVN
jgi:hypothetical protein